MAMLCIGGVCVPYSALLPLLVIGMKWILQKLVEFGLLPKSIEQLLLRGQPGQSKNKNIGGSCGGRSRDKRQKASAGSTDDNNKTLNRSATASTTDTAASASADDNDSSQPPVIIEINSEEEWEALMSQQRSLKVIVKFTASWCRPCKAIHPYLVELAKECIEKNKSSSNNFVFVTIDSDEFDEISGQYDITMLPTFCAIQNHQLLDKYAGSNRDKLREFVEKNTS